MINFWFPPLQSWSFMSQNDQKRALEKRVTPIRRRRSKIPGYFWTKNTFLKWTSGPLYHVSWVFENPVTIAFSGKKFSESDRMENIFTENCAKQKLSVGTSRLADFFGANIKKVPIANLWRKMFFSWISSLPKHPPTMGKPKNICLC